MQTTVGTLRSFVCCPPPLIELQYDLVRGNGGLVTIIGAGAFLTVTHKLNNAGSVGFIDEVGLGNYDAFVSDGVSTTPIASDVLNWSVAINELGDTVYRPASLNRLVFVPSGGTGVTVVEGGTPVDGSTVSGPLSISAYCLNDAGQICFLATLTDGRTGIFRADPIVQSVPTLSIWGSGLLLLAVLMAGSLVKPSRVLRVL